MYKVIIVDDEPSACRHIGMIIERYCPNFQVVASAENGQDAIKKIEAHYCDVLITDVCMPLMDGIELIEWIDAQGLKIKTIVTSGYQEFDYVQKAINLGACSYLLKPVVPLKMSDTLQKLEDELDRGYMQDQIQLFNAFYYKESFDEQLIRKIFPYKHYFLAVKRINGLPTRYNKNNPLEIFAEYNKSMIIYGRDVYEELFFIPQELVSGLGVVEFVENESNLELNNGYETLVYFNEPMKVDDFFIKVKELYRGLDSAIIIGESQSATVEEVRSVIKEHIASSQNDDLEQLYYYISEKQSRSIQKELEVLFAKWKADKRTQLYIEALAKQILYKMRNSYGNKVSFLETEYLIEEIFTYSTTINELKDNYHEILIRFIQSDPIVDKIDTPQFLNKITKYLNSHLDQQMPLKDLCKKFGVSQPYLSKMFRKYIDESYNHYSTRIRIEKARELMTQNSEIRVKDVAAMVGYGDQFYFSRIFRSYMDITPSEFINRLKTDGEGVYPKQIMNETIENT